MADFSYREGGCLMLKRLLWLMVFFALFSGKGSAEGLLSKMDELEGKVATPLEGISFKIISAGEQSSYEGGPSLVVIRQAAEWEPFWKQVMGDDSPVPQVDFENEMVIAGFAGVKPTSGYYIKIKNIEEFDKNLYVSVEMGGWGMLDVMTYPYQIVRLKKSNLPPLVRVTEITTKHHDLPAQDAATFLAGSVGR